VMMTKSGFYEAEAQYIFTPYLEGQYENNFRI